MEDRGGRRRAAVGFVVAALAIVAVAAGGTIGRRPAQEATAAGVAASPAGPASSGARAIDPAAGIQNIEHLIFVVQENRSFDHLFGTFPGANGIPRKADGSFRPCIPDPAAGVCRRPYHDTNVFDHGAAHSKRASDMAVDGGKMDGFIRVQEEMYSLCKAEPELRECRLATPGPAGTPDVMGFHTGAEIPNYWAYARRYLLQDRMFAPSDSWTEPSHLYMLSGWSASCPDQHDVTSCVTDLKQPDLGWTPQDGGQGPYLWADITWLLEQQHVPWAYYVGPGTCVRAPCAETTDPATSFILNPLPGFRTVEATDSYGNIKPYGDYFTRAANGTLPAVSWVVPTPDRSDHPPRSLGRGQAWVTRVVNAVMQGPSDQWAHTAIFLTWDDWGGFYDHVKPIRIDGGGYGIRVPAIVLSPWVKSGLDVDHQTYSFDSYLRLIEDRFLGGQRLDPQTDGWYDPRPTVREEVQGLGDLRTIFDFTQDPLPPLVLDPKR